MRARGNIDSSDVIIVVLSVTTGDSIWTRGSSSDLRLKIAVLSPTEEGPSGRTNTEVEKSYESEQVQRHHNCVRVYSKQGQETISNETWPQIQKSPIISRRKTQARGKPGVVVLYDSSREEKSIHEGSTT